MKKSKKLVLALALTLALAFCLTGCLTLEEVKYVQFTGNVKPFYAVGESVPASNFEVRIGKFTGSDDIYSLQEFAKAGTISGNGYDAASGTLKTSEKGAYTVTLTYQGISSTNTYEVVDVISKATLSDTLLTVYSVAGSLEGYAFKIDETSVTLESAGMQDGFYIYTTNYKTDESGISVTATKGNYSCSYTIGLNWSAYASDSLIKDDADGFYQIGSAADLARLALVVNANTDKTAAFNAKLTANIDLNPEGIDLQWLPIGTKANPYKGEFNGNGKTISNLYITEEELTSYQNSSGATITGCYLGLFGLAKEATIKDFTIDGAIVSVDSKLANESGKNHGAVAGGIDGSIIENVTVKGNVAITGIGRNAAIVGVTEGSTGSAIVGCTVEGTADAKISIKSNNNVLTDYLDGEGDKAGAIIGQSQCSKTGTYNGTTFTGVYVAKNTVSYVAIEATRDMGGLIGYTSYATVVDNTLSNIAILNKAYGGYAPSKGACNAGGVIGTLQAYGNTATSYTADFLVVKNNKLDGIEINTTEGKTDINVGTVLGGLRRSNTVAVINYGGASSYTSTALRGILSGSDLAIFAQFVQQHAAEMAKINTALATTNHADVTID